MNELNVIIVTTLISLLIWVGVEARQVSRETFISPELLESTYPIDGTIDSDYLIRLDFPANVQ